MTPSPTPRTRPKAALTDAARLRLAILALVRRFAISERADVVCCGMTVAQAATLEALAEGPLRARALGSRLGVTPSTLSRNLDRLEERGLCERVPDQADARAWQVRLTPAGHRAATEISKIGEEFAGAILAALPSGTRADVVDRLEELLGAVRAATEECCPGAFDHLMKDFPRPPAKESSR